MMVQALGVTGYPTFHYYIGDTLVMKHTGGEKAELEKNVKRLSEKTKEELLASSDAKKESFVEVRQH